LLTSTSPSPFSVRMIIAIRILVRLSIVEAAARLIVGVSIAGTLKGTNHVVALGLPMVSIMISFLDLILGIEKVENHRLNSLLLLRMSHLFKLSAELIDMTVVANVVMLVRRRRRLSYYH